MTKSEFVEGLGKSLKGKIDDNEYAKQLNYYSGYIDDECANGRSEQEVVDELGDPRLIAKTIVQTYVMKDDPIRNQYKTEANGYARNEYEDYAENNEDTDNKFEEYAHKAKRTLYIILGILILLFIVSFVFKVLAVLAPVIFVLIAVCIILRMFRQ